MATSTEPCHSATTLANESSSGQDASSRAVSGESAGAASIDTNQSIAVSSLVSKIRGLHSRLHDMEVVNEQLTLRNQGLTARLARVKNHAALQMEQNEQLAADLKQAKADLAREILSSSNAESMTSPEDVTIHQEQLLAAKEKISAEPSTALRQENMSLKQKIVDLKGEINKASMDATRSSAKIGDLMANVASKNRQNHDLNVEIEQLERQKAGLASDVVKFRSQPNVWESRLHECNKAVYDEELRAPILFETAKILEIKDHELEEREKHGIVLQGTIDELCGEKKALEQRISRLEWEKSASERRSEQSRPIADHFRTAYEITAKYATARLPCQMVIRRTIMNLISENKRLELARCQELVDAGNTISDLEFRNRRLEEHYQDVSSELEQKRVELSEFDAAKFKKENADVTLEKKSKEDDKMIRRLKKTIDRLRAKFQQFDTLDADNKFKHLLEEKKDEIASLQVQLAEGHEQVDRVTNDWWIRDEWEKDNQLHVTDMEQKLDDQKKKRLEQEEVNDDLQDKLKEAQEQIKKQKIDIQILGIQVRAAEAKCGAPPSLPIPHIHAYNTGIYVSIEAGVSNTGPDQSNSPASSQASLTASSQSNTYRRKLGAVGSRRSTSTVIKSAPSRGLPQGHFMNSVRDADVQSTASDSSSEDEDERISNYVF